MTHRKLEPEKHQKNRSERDPVFHGKIAIAMALDLADCTFHGQAMPEAFAKTRLFGLLREAGLWPDEDATEAGAAGLAFGRAWDEYRSALADLPPNGGPLDVARHVLEPLAPQLGYAGLHRGGEAATREGIEDGGWVFQTHRKNTLRAFATGFGARLDAPPERGRPRRFGPMQIARRVMQAKDEPLALLTNGIELRVLFRDLARRGSHWALSLEPPTGSRKSATRAPDSLRLLSALASPAGIARLPALLEAARREAAHVTDVLRAQTKTAISSVLDDLVGDPRNALFFEKYQDKQALARSLFRDALVVVHRLLFRLKLEASEAAPGPAFDKLFGALPAPLFDDERLIGGERAAARLEGALSFAPRAAGEAPSRVLYDSLSVEELGRVYEALLEVEPGIATAPMCRLRRQKLEIVVPRAQGEARRWGAARVSFMEDIREGAFFLRAGLGRKTTGSYYTPPALVRFLIEETLGPRVAALSPPDDPRPAEILKLTVLDPAVGSGHFLVEACRFLGDELFDACFLCDERARLAEEAAAQARSAEERAELLACAASWRQRVLALPDSSAEALAHLSSQTLGVSEGKAKAICRRLVAAACLYGVDENPLAVELAKLSLFLTSYVEALPFPRLDHRLVEGNSLTGPMFADLAPSPGDARLHKRLAEALAGKPLTPLRTLAAAWSGAVMLGEEADDAAYEALREAVAKDADVEALVSASPALARMIEAGKKAIAYDLRFPDVFYPSGDTRERAGFSAVVGNPPWDAIQPLAKEFYAALDLSVLDAPTRLERAAVEDRLKADASVRLAFARYVAGLEQTKRVIGRWSRHVNRGAGGAPCGAIMDLWQGFAERGHTLLGVDGALGMVLPSAFHANQSATGIRELFLDHARLQKCYSFENREKIFEIHGSFKFDLVVASRGSAATGKVECAFSVRRLDWLFGTPGTLFYTRDFIRRTGGRYQTLLELQNEKDAAVARACFAASVSAGEIRESRRLRMGEELHMSKAAHLFTRAADTPFAAMDPREPEAGRLTREGGFLPLHEGKTFHQYTDRWDEPPRYLVARSRLAEKPSLPRAASYFRLAFRAIASSTNERTAIFAFIPPGYVFGNSAPCEREPWARPSKNALLLLACANSFVFDWNLRRRSTANVNPFILDACPIPPALLEGPRAALLVHAALRLTCNHEGYAPLFREQLGPVRGYPGQTFPVLGDDAARASVRAAVDAVVAAAYGLGREDYAHVLASFSHKSRPKDPELCLAAADELARTGLDAFARANDPYHDVPLDEALAAPVLEPR